MLKYQTASGRWRHHSTTVCLGQEELDEQLRYYTKLPTYRIEVRTFGRGVVRRALEAL